MSAKPFTFTVLALLLLPIAAAMAQDRSVMQAIMADKVAQQHVAEAAGQSLVFLKNPCPSARFTPTGQVAIYVMPERDAAGAIGKGAWKEEVREEGCGASRILNVLGFISEPGKLNAMPLLPGATRGVPLLQKDAVQYAFIAAKVTSKDCTEAYVEDTAFVDQGNKPIAGGKGPPWRELWTIDLCGRKTQVTMRFTPDSTGTTIGAESPRLTPAEPKK
jgi:hypothetical protein